VIKKNKGLVFSAFRAHATHPKKKDSRFPYKERFNSYTNIHGFDFSIYPAHGLTPINI